MQKKGVLKLILALVLIVILAGIIFIVYQYFKSPEKTLGIGANIESVLLSEDGKTAYIELAGGSLVNVTKIKFIFSDKESREYNYETSDGAQEISVPYSRGFLDWLFGKKLIGNYEYKIGSIEINLSDFNDIENVSVVFIYQEEGRIIETPLLNTGTNITRAPSCTDGIKNGNETGIDCGGSCRACGSGGGRDDDGGGRCTNDAGCTNTGGFCDGNLSYECAIGSDGCLDRINENNCTLEGKICYSGNCANASIKEIFYRTDEDTQINITLNSSITGDFIIITPPEYGTTQNKTSLNNINFVNITYTPDVNYNGQDYFVYNVSDGINYEIIRINITIIPVDDAPILMTESYKSITSIVFGVNATSVEKSYKLLITEVDGDSLNYSVSNLPSGATLNSETGVLEWIVSNANIGNYTNIIFSVTDLTPAKLSDTKIINITIRQAKTYYCNPIGGNTTTGDGSAGNPWGTLQSVGEAGYFNEIKIKSGDTIKLKNGYHGGLSIWKKANTDYIIIEADTGAVPDLSNIVLKYTDYWNFKGLRISPSFAGPVTGGGSMISGYSNRFIKVENCIMYPVDNASSWGTNEWSTLAWSGIVLGYTGGCIARNNIIRNVRSGINFGSLIIENNTIDGFSGDGMYVSENSVLQDNIIINKHDPADGFHNDGIQGWSSMTKNITVRRNYINARTDPNRNDSTVGGLQGMFFEGNISGRIENNVILAKNSAWGIGLNAGTHDIYIFNNTIMRPYLIGDWPNIQLSSYAIDTLVKNNIADGIPSSNTTRNITSENNLKITNYNETQILSFFVDYPHGDVRPLMNSPMCDGSVNGMPGVAVGALPCVEIIVESESQIASFSPFTKLWNFLKSILTTKTGKAITGNVVLEEADYKKTFATFGIAVIIIIALIVVIMKFVKPRKKSKGQ